VTRVGRGRPEGVFAAEADGAAALVEALGANWDVEWVAGTERKAGTLTVLIRQ